MIISPPLPSSAKAFKLAGLSANVWATSAEVTSASASTILLVRFPFAVVSIEPV